MPPMLPGVTDVELEQRYLQTLAPGSRRAQTQAMQVLRYELHPKTWRTLLRADVLQVRETLAERYAPATARRIMAALIGVLREAYLAGVYTIEQYTSLGWWSETDG